MGEQVPKGLAPRLFPGKHALVVHVLRFRSRQRRAVQRAARPVFAGAVRIGVEGVVQGLHLFGGKEVAHHEKPLEIIEVLLAFAHHGEVFGIGKHGHVGVLACRWSSGPASATRQHPEGSDLSLMGRMKQI